VLCVEPQESESASIASFSLPLPGLLVTYYSPSLLHSDYQVRGEGEREGERSVVGVV